MCVLVGVLEHCIARTVLTQCVPRIQKLQFPATNVIGLAWSHTGWRGPYLPKDIEHKIFPDYAEDPFIVRYRERDYVE